MRGNSVAVFKDGESFNFTVHTDQGAFDVVHKTRWLKVGSGVCPGHMLVEIRGTAPALRDAIDMFPQAGSMLSPIIAISANAAVGFQEIELGFDVTPGITERDYFQQYVLPERQGAVSAGRLINVEATNVFLQHVLRSPHRDRLLRAMAQYQITLEHWRLGSTILAVSHLWMAVEALTKVRIRVEIARRDLATELELAEVLGVDIKKLDSTIRRQYIFQGDDDCYSKALSASDGFEHGFSPNDKLHQLTANVRDKTAQYVRSEIFTLSGTPEPAIKCLHAAPFNDPQGPGLIAKYLFGKLIGTGEELAATGNPYPILSWRLNLDSGQVDSSGKIDLQITDTITPQLASGIAFQAIRSEVWKP